MEYTFVMIRPGAIRRNKVQMIFNKILTAGLKIEKCGKRNLTEKFLQEHYKDIYESEDPILKDVFSRILKENLSGEVFGLVVSGEDAIKKMRDLIGPGNVAEARKKAPYSIRALYGDPENNPDNLIHAADNIDKAREEMNRFFGYDVYSLLTEESIQSPKVLSLKPKI